MEEAGKSHEYIKISPQHDYIIYQAMKELTGFARPKITENFASYLQLHMLDKGESWEITKVLHLQ